MPKNRIVKAPPGASRPGRGKMMLEGAYERIGRWRPTFRRLGDLTAPKDNDALEPLLDRLRELPGTLDGAAPGGVR